MPLFTIIEEVETAVEKLRGKKAPGPDGLGSETVKVLFHIAPDYCVNVFNSLLSDGIFPRIWKKADLVLIEKGKKDACGQMTYRPVCLLDALGKVMEDLLRGRLIEEIDENGGLAENQYGFRARRSTIDAMKKVITFAEEAKRKRKLCAMVLLDVKNAFNSMPWKGIIDELKRRNVSEYITRIFCSYFQDRELRVADNTVLNLSCGVPQDSKVGPTLWNIYYDSVLRLSLPPNTNTITYADDLVVITCGETKEELESEVNTAICIIGEWMKDHNLKIAPQKTEVVLLRSKRTCKEIEVIVDGTLIRSKMTAKHLGVLFDQNLRMTEHIKMAAAKAERVAVNLV